MAFNRTTAFGTTYGNVSDAERMAAQQNQFNSNQAFQLAALQAEMADRAAGRNFQGGLADKEMTFQGGMFDKNAGLQKDLDRSATERALGVVDRQMQPSLLDAQLRQREANIDLPIREMRGQATQMALQQAIGQMKGAGAAPGGAPMDDSLMFLAFGGNPGELANIRRQEMQAKQTREDSIDNRNQALAIEMMKSANPQARALGASILAKTQTSGFAGADTATLQNALTPQATPAEAIGKKVALSQALTQLKTAADRGANSMFSGDDVAQVKAQTDQLVKMLVDNGVPEEEARAYIQQEIDKVAPAENALHLGYYFPSISSTGQVRQAAGLAR